MNSFIWKNPANAGGGGNITQLEQKVQQLEQQLQTLVQQLQTLTQQLNSKAGKAEANTFTQKQKITTPNDSLTLVQDNNAVFVSFAESGGARRGYVGMGSSNSNKIHLDGKDGVQITSTSGNLELNPAASIDAKNKPILNVGQSNDNNAALSKNLLGSKIKHYLKLGGDINNGVATITLPTNGLAVFSYLIKQNGGGEIINNLVKNVSIRNNQVEFTLNNNLFGIASFDIWYLEA